MAIKAVTRLFTAADLAAMPEELPSGPAHYELREGVLSIMTPPGFDHTRVEGAFVTLFRVRGEWQGHGQAGSGEGGIVLRRDPDTVYGADAYFLTNEQLPPRLSREGYLETIPAIVAEVRSKNDRNKKVADKVADYLAAGVRIVVVADPRRKRVTVHRPGQPEIVLGIDDALNLHDVIPGFAEPVAELFRGLP